MCNLSISIRVYIRTQGCFQSKLKVTASAYMVIVVVYVKLLKQVFYLKTNLPHSEICQK